MPNMSYCRFRNTLNDLKDCQYNFDSIESIEELVAAKRLLKVCQEIVDTVDMEDLDQIGMFIDEEEWEKENGR
jgi:hypothetical protein